MSIEISSDGHVVPVQSDESPDVTISMTRHLRYRQLPYQRKIYAEYQIGWVLVGDFFACPARGVGFHATLGEAYGRGVPAQAVSSGEVRHRENITVLVT